MSLSQQLLEGFGRLGLSGRGDKGNFVLFSHENAAGIFADLQNMDIIVRPLAGYGLKEYLRVTIGSEEQNARLLEALSSLLN